MRTKLDKTLTIVVISSSLNQHFRGSNSGGGEFFRTCPDRPWDPTNLLYNSYGVFSGGKERPGRDADPSFLLVPWT